VLKTHQTVSCGSEPSRQSTMGSDDLEEKNGTAYLATVRYELRFINHPHDTNMMKAVCDWPAICFAKELIEAYPEAKVILTTRNVDTWHASVMKTGYWRAKDPELRIASYFDWGAGLYYPMLTKFFETFFKDDFPNKGKEVFAEHYKEVRSLVPKNNLLEFNVAEGWGPLCDFLGEPMPLNEPFPHANNADSFVKRCRARNRAQMCNAAFRYAVIGVLLYLAYLILGYILMF